jgi:hypothetical protein
VSDLSDDLSDVPSVKRGSTRPVRPVRPCLSTVSAHVRPVCENFLYVFKAARWAARAAAAAAFASAPASAPATAGQTPVGWREKRKAPGRQIVERSPALRVLRGAAGWLPLLHCPGRAEPVKGAYGVGSAADP